MATIQESPVDRFCGVVIKDEIAGSVVYPKASDLLAHYYRCRSIDGASAGAIAAGVASAALYRLLGRVRPDREHPPGYKEPMTQEQRRKLDAFVTALRDLATVMTTLAQPIPFKPIPAPELRSIRRCRVGAGGSCAEAPTTLIRIYPSADLEAIRNK
ncbi:MAG: hypothetical protein IT391_00845 [Nitrospira sp.]|nr:hypothetical protein [Nitrospira sp.]